MKPPFASTTTSSGSPAKLNGPFESCWFQEVRGKYARPVLLSNGVFKLRPGDKPRVEPEFGAYTTWSVSPSKTQPVAMTRTAPSTPHRSQPQAFSPPRYPQSAVLEHEISQQPKATTMPKRYILELEALVKSEKRVRIRQKRVMIERKLRLVKSEQRVRVSGRK